MVNSLEQAQELHEKDLEQIKLGHKPIYNIAIYREVQYYANINGVHYILQNDCRTQLITEHIDEYFKKDSLME